MQKKPRGPAATLLLASCAALPVSCTQDTEIIPQKAVLTTVSLIDAGLVAVGDRETVNISFRSEGRAPIYVQDIVLENEGDEEVFVLLPWQDEDDTLYIEPGSEEVPSTETVQVSFRPEEAGYFRALMTITSNDTEVDDGIWKVALRGMAQYPCGSMAPTFIDYGYHVSGGYFSEWVEVYNCGMVTLTIAAFEIEGSSSYYVQTPDPVYVVPGDSESVEVAWIPSSTGSAETATVEFKTNDDEFEPYVDVIGNDCESSVDLSWDDDSDGWFTCAGDCDDTDAQVSPSNIERQNGYDDDCDGNIDESANSTSSDDDGDAYTESEGDCDDADSAIYPEATEVIDQIDNDCNGLVDDATEWYDDDKDGFSEREGDCDDGDVLTYPGADESIDDIDNDCDGDIDEGGLNFDDDGDGYTDNNGDCDDGDPWSFPDAPEDCDDVDNDCDDETDEDDACAYLVDRDEDEYEESSGGQGSCATAAPARRTPALAAALAGLLLGRLRRRRSHG